MRSIVILGRSEAETRGPMEQPNLLGSRIALRASENDEVG
jgi:hypothetical protein